ncbi:MAG: D-tyrosyl-tRNA(Tyr) deacylase [Bacteroidetes bacterium]|nr:D-tyrosyl-tRNA(Tyr) deacylase [Bacteroidota bacterium]
MIALIQRVKRARVTVDGRETGAIGEGLLILLGVHTSDTKDLIPWLAGKCARLRIFPDEEGRMNRSLIDHGGSALVVSQFTLYGNAEKGNRPSFIESARPEVAEPLYEAFCTALSEALGQPVATGEFGAMMDVDLLNWGPVTLSIERRNT